MNRTTLLVFVGLALGACDGRSATDAPTLRQALDAGPDAMLNEVPVPLADTVSVDEDGSTEIDVLANDSDPDGDPLTIYLVDAPTDGTLTAVGDAFVYEPRANFNGTDTFRYGVLDGHGGEANALVDITVNPVNDPPAFTSPTPPELATLRVTAGELLEFRIAATDVDDDLLTFGFEPLGAASEPTIDAGALSWTPGPSDVGMHTLTIWVDDGTVRGARDLTLDVSEPPDQPCGQYRCGGDEVCFEESCYSACQSEADCEGSKLCVDGRCVAEPCQGVVCVDPETCIDGFCQQPCLTHDECGAGERCLGMRCLEVLNDCGGDGCCGDGACDAGTGPKFESNGCGCTVAGRSRFALWSLAFAALCVVAARRLRLT